MLRLFIGFVLGVVTSYYSMPSLFKLTVLLPEVNFERFFSNDQPLTSNTINATHPSEFENTAAHNAISERVEIARSLAELHPTQDPASIEVTEVLFNLARKSPQAQALLQEKLPGGLTNGEALSILSSIGTRG